MRQPSRVVAIGLVGHQGLERLVGLPALDADHGQAELAQPVKQAVSEQRRAIVGRGSLTE